MFRAQSLTDRVSLDLNHVNCFIYLKSSKYYCLLLNMHIRSIFVSFFTLTSK